MSGFGPDHVGAEVRVSPNFGPRRDGAVPRMIILHYTGMLSDEGAEAWLCDPASEVSSHYLVHQDGRIVQMVREADRAWHAGRGSWHGITDVNSHSIGIEIANAGNLAGNPPFPDVQIAAVVALCRDIIDRHGIAPDMVLGHSDVAPGRKVDPGPRFPWHVLRDSGIGLLPVPAVCDLKDMLAPGDSGPGVEALQSMLQLVGYGVEITGHYDAATRAVVEAFQLHFRQDQVDGIADQPTVALVSGLLEWRLRLA